MAKILRGDILWADLNPVVGHEQSGVRPVLVLSHQEFNRYSGTVIAVALTSQKPRADFPLSLKLSHPKLKKDSWVKISQIRVLSTKRLKKKIASAASKDLDLVIEGLNEIIS